MSGGLRGGGGGEEEGGRWLVGAQNSLPPAAVQKQ